MPRLSAQPTRIGPTIWSVLTGAPLFWAIGVGTKGLINSPDEPPAKPSKHEVSDANQRISGDHCKRQVSLPLAKLIQVRPSRDNDLVSNLGRKWFCSSFDSDQAPCRSNQFPSGHHDIGITKLLTMD